MSVKRLAALVAAVALLGALIPATALAKTDNTSNNLCPSLNGIGTFVAADNVGATASGTNPRTYFFSSFQDENPTKGVPGLVGYCVYPNTPATSPTATATGSNGTSWTATLLKGTKGFVFQRVGGNAGNIPLDGTLNIEIGTAKITGSPTPETILLHIADAAQCRSLYGALSPDTCWVLPKSGPVCDAASGDANTAYDSYPKDVLGCGPPSYAFEANSVTEFGDKVTLGATGTLNSLKVVFNSYGCGDSGKWYTADCKTTDGEVFTIPGGITAKIYDASDLTTPLATATINPSIPFRPSNILDTSCPNPPVDAANSRFLNPASGLCEYSIKVLLTFDNWSSTPPLSPASDVVWTVSFNTTHYGNPTPIGEGAPCYGVDGGCGYDSLNVGTKDYTGAPYSGIDPVATEAVRRIDAGTLGLFTIGADQRPLGEIVLTP